MSHGRYRSLYCSLVDDPDFQRLSSDARLALLTARVCDQAGAAAIFRYYPELLAKQTGLPIRRLEPALAELEREMWIVREGVVLWIRNGLRHDPTMRLGDRKHRIAVERAVKCLPRLPIVLRFCDYYEITRPFDTPTRLGPPSPIPNTDSESDSERTTLSGSEAVARPHAAFREQAKEVLNFLNEKTGRSYRSVDANLRLIEARLRSGATVENCKGVVARKVREWAGDPTMAKYLRPATLFNAEKFESYFGQREKARV